MSLQLPTSQQVYQVQQPKVWPAVPETYSFSSLSAIDTCPYQYQLLRGRFEGFETFPQRSNPKTVEGRIIHELLDQLFKKLSLLGLPPRGSPELKEAIDSFNLVERANQAIVTESEKSKSNPRVGADLTGRITAMDILNKVMRQFRAEYNTARAGTPSPVMPGYQTGLPVEDDADLLAVLKQRQVLTELPLNHGALPFRGIIDLVRADGNETVLVDFKTGKEKDEHALQLKYYAVLWWRRTGQRPAKLELRYPHSSKAVDYNPKDLESIEKSLAKRIELATKMLSPDRAPAAAQIGDHCRFCEPRAYCDAYWTGRRSLRITGIRGAQPGEQIDLELMIQDLVGDTVLKVSDEKEKTVELTYPSGSQNVFGKFELGKKLRLIGSYVSNDRKYLELRPWSEAYRC